MGYTKADYPRREGKMIELHLDYDGDGCYSGSVDLPDGRELAASIDRDSYPESPREWDNLGVMLYWTTRHVYGDQRVEAPGRDLGRADWERRYLPDDIAALLPLYVISHGGSFIRTTPYNDPWDSGQVGVIYATKEAIRESYGVKRISRKLKDRVEDHLRSEVEEYNDYLNGNCWGFTFEILRSDKCDCCGHVRQHTEDTHTEHGGYIGDPDAWALDALNGYLQLYGVVAKI